MASSSFSSMIYSEQLAYKCSVCLDHFKEPKVISCGHTFCLNCIEQLPTRRRHYKKIFDCPECRSQVEFPPSDRVEDFPTNFAIKGAIEQSLEGCTLQRVCKTHTKDRDIFCNTCKKCICVDCFVGKHKAKGHDVTSTSEQANETAEQLRQAEEGYRQSEYAKLFERILEIENSSVENADTIIIRINEERHQMIEEIERQGDQLVKVVEVVTEDKKNELAKIKRGIEKRHTENLEKAEQCSSLLNEIGKFGLSQERFEKSRRLCGSKEKNDTVNGCHKVEECSDDEETDDTEEVNDDYRTFDDDKPTNSALSSDEGEDNCDYKSKAATDHEDHEFALSSFNELEKINSTLEFQENYENNYFVFGSVKQNKSKLCYQ